MIRLTDLAQKQMTRKEFLITLGFGLAALLGLSGVIRLLTGKENPLQQTHPLGYGSGTYGNIRK